MLFGNFEVLANGHIIVPHYNQHRVVEYDHDGKQVGNPIINQQWPNSVVRLPNGNLLLTSQNLRQVNEFDRSTSTGIHLYRQWQCLRGPAPLRSSCKPSKPQDDAAIPGGLFNQRPPRIAALMVGLAEFPNLFGRISP